MGKRITMCARTGGETRSFRGRGSRFLNNVVCETMYVTVIKKGISAPSAYNHPG